MFVQTNALKSPAQDAIFTQLPLDCSKMSTSLNIITKDGHAWLVLVCSKYTQHTQVDAHMDASTHTHTCTVTQTLTHTSTSRVMLVNKRRGFDRDLRKECSIRSPASHDC